MKASEKNGNKESKAQTPKKDGSAKINVSESQKQMLFALLAIAALGVAAYALFLSEPADNPADGSAFYYKLSESDKVSILYDVRGATDAQTSAIYQCGVDMISKGRFAGKTLYNIGCDSSGCVSASSAANGSDRLTFEQAKKRAATMPYFIIKQGDTSAYSFFERHMEITVGKDYSATYNTTSCDISATVG